MNSKINLGALIVPCPDQLWHSSIHSSQINWASLGDVETGLGNCSTINHSASQCLKCPILLIFCKLE